MELSEVINPLYAFPVVGVLIFALLVFAFGFKSPAQPPSFDFDEEKKTSGSKKRKPVKKGASSSQVLSVPDVSTKGSTTEKTSKQSTEKQAVSPKARQQKNSSISAEKSSTNKQLIKNKKNEKNERNALKKKEEKVSDDKEKQAPKKEETGEWVQHLTRKEKKNRKRDEFNGNGDDDDLKIDGSTGGTPEKKHPALSRVQDTKGSSPSKRKKKSTAGNKENGVATPLEEKVKKENAKNEINIVKEKLEKEDNFKNDAEIKIVEELKETNNTVLQPAQTKEDLSVKLIAKAVVSEQIKSQETPVEASPKTKKAKKNKAKSETADQSVPAVPVSTTVVDKQVSAPKDVKAAVAEIQIEDAPKTEVEVSGNAGGVAFDELKDVWQEPKVQKKKKKARKDQ